MKKNSLLVGLGIFCAVILFSCKKDKQITTESETLVASKDGDIYELDTLNSKIEWKGFKIFKTENTSHFGNIKFENGEVVIKDGKLTSGNFIADISSLVNVDLAGNSEMKKNLEKHLKSADFFEVDKFPTATYEITKVSEGEGDYNAILDGNLTIKGITKPIQFNANVFIDKDVVSIATEPKDINREDFGIHFKIPIADGLIKNEINLQILVKAQEVK